MYQLNLDFIPAGQMLSTYAFRCPGILQPVEIGARGALFIMEDQGIRSNALLAGMIFVMHWVSRCASGLRLPKVSAR